MIINRKKLMIVGPTEIEEDILKIGSERMMYNRTSEFSEFMKNINENLQYFFQTKNQIFTFVSSGTGAMEASISNTMSAGDKVIVIARGQWGLRWAEIAKSYNIDVKLIKLDLEEQVDPEELKLFLNEDVKGVFTNANETTSGLLTNINEIGAIVKESKAIFVVDAISSIGADEFKTDEWNCDIVIASSQKALALPPGISFLSLSSKAKDMMETSNLPKYYFDMKDYGEKDLPRGQTPFTPAIGLLYQLDSRLQKIKEEGIENVISRHARLSKILRVGINEIGLKFLGQNMSNGVTGILAPEGINAREIISLLRNEHDIEIPPSPGELEKKVFRVGVFGNITEEDVVFFLNALESVLIKLGYNFKKGLAEKK